MSAQSGAVTRVEEWISEPYRELGSGSTRLREIRAALDEHGLVELPGLLTSPAHALLKEQILALESAASRSDQGGNRKFSIKGDALSDTVVGQLARSTFMCDLVNNLLGPIDGLPRLADPAIRSDEIIPGINLMRGPGDVTAYHFDGSYLNLIFPVIIPKPSGPRRGQLVIYPNLRPSRGPSGARRWYRLFCGFRRCGDHGSGVRSTTGRTPCMRSTATAAITGSSRPTRRRCGALRT